MMRFLAGLVASVVLVAAIAAGLVLAADPLLTVRTGTRPSDVIVVLGGDGPRRAGKAVMLYREGVAPHILVTGDGDCLSIRDAMVERGVPQAAITVECKSRDTRENGLFSAPLLARMQARRVVLVTSWFHTRRALAAFNAASPRIALMAAPVEPHPEPLERLREVDATRAALEYVKIGWYAVRFGILPFPRVERDTVLDPSVDEATVIHPGGPS